MRNTKLQLTLAADEPVTPAEMTKALREGGTAFTQCVAGLEEYLDEPLKSKFSQVKKQINTMLAGLPDSDKVPAALESNGALRQLLYAFQTAQMLISSLSETAKTSATALASTKASLTGEIQTAIDAKVKAGEFITKEDADKRVQDATSAATTSARASALAETKRIGDRRQVLATATLPVPADEILTAIEDKDFDTRKTAVAKRVEDLKPYGLPAERVLALAWNTDEAAYADTLSLMKDVAAKAGKPAGGPNGFLKRDGSDKPAKAKVSLC